MARAIGDGSVGEGLLPYPHITQLEIPSTCKSHFILASDGVWDSAIPEAEMFRLLQVCPLSQAASTILSLTTKPLQDDTTLIALEIGPPICVDKVCAAFFWQRSVSLTCFALFCASLYSSWT